MLAAQESQTGCLDPRYIQSSFYSELYKLANSDSPDASRTSLLRRSHPYLSQLPSSAMVLELGSGKQIVTNQYLRDRKIRPPFRIVTLDIAELHRRQLLAKNRPTVSHIRGDGSRLPFKQCFSFGFSNMALDFMGEQAIIELYRVLIPGSRAEVNLHHPKLIPDNLDELLKLVNLTNRQRDVFEYWSYLKEHNILSDDSNVIQSRFTNAGFFVESIAEATDKTDTWWEVSLIKK